MCMSSIPARVTAADQNDWKPSIGRTRRLMARWSCSTIIIEVFDLAHLDVRFVFFIVALDRCRIRSALVYRDFPGHPMLSDCFTQKAQRAAVRSRLAVNRKSTVLPPLSTARY